MTLKGTLDFRISNNTSASLDAFVTIYRFFQKNTASLGIVQIASNFGVSGSGFDYRNQPTFVGNNCWACFKYANASTPFYVLIQAATGTNYPLGNGPGAPGKLLANKTTGVSYGKPDTGGVGISIALRTDGQSPWGGTTNNNGSDTKGNPVWVGDYPELYVWPRSNSFSGTHSISRENMMTLFNQSTFPSFTSQNCSILGDENNIFFFSNWGSTTVNGADFFFGKVTTHVSSSRNIGNTYACMSLPNNETTNGNVFPIYPGTTGAETINIFGTLSGSSDNEGGVMSTIPGEGVRGFVLEVPIRLFSTTFHPNSCHVTASYDTIKPHVFAYESPRFYGSIGFIDFFRFAYNIATYTTETNGSAIVVGRNATAAIHVVSPWSGSVVANTATFRTGTDIV